MDFDSLKKAGTGLGSAGVIVVDDATCMVSQTLKFSNFFKAESCGQCPPCRMGTINLATLMTKIEAGEGTQKDLDSLVTALRIRQRNGILHAGDRSSGAGAEQRRTVPS